MAVGRDGTLNLRKFRRLNRMPGIVADVEDILEETFIRWQQARDDEIRSPRGA